MIMLKLVIKAWPPVSNCNEAVEVEGRTVMALVGVAALVVRGDVIGLRLEDSRHCGAIWYYTACASCDQWCIL